MADERQRRNTEDEEARGDARNEKGREKKRTGLRGGSEGMKGNAGREAANGQVQTAGGEPAR